MALDSSAFDSESESSIALRLIGIQQLGLYTSLDSLPLTLFTALPLTLFATLPLTLLAECVDVPLSLSLFSEHVDVLLSFALFADVSALLSQKDLNHFLNSSGPFKCTLPLRPTPS